MGQYRVNHAYRAWRDGRQFGPYEPDTIVDLDPADADWVNRDSPGALSPAQPEPEPQAPAEREAAPAPNRQARGGRNRAGA